MVRILVVETEKSLRAAETQDTLEIIQAVGAGLSRWYAPLFQVGNPALRGRAENAEASDELGFLSTVYRTIYNIVAGTFFLCAAPQVSNRFGSLSEEQIVRCGMYINCLH